MNATEKDILRLLKENKSQNAIANELGVPRSLVQRVSDTELGVDPASLKSLTTEDIMSIQTQSAAGVSNRTLAEKYDVSPKTIARALMVRVELQSNNVQVLSPIKVEEQHNYEVQPGGVSKDVDEKEWYIGAFLENHNKYLALRFITQKGVSVVEGKFFDKSELTAQETGSFNEETVGLLAELSVSLVEGVSQAPGIVVKVYTGGSEAIPTTEDSYPLESKLDVRRRVGYRDVILNRTGRIALSSVVFLVKSAHTEDGKLPEKKTKSDFDVKNLDVFLNQHQILILPESIVIAIDGKPETITTSHQAYDRIVAAIKAQDIQLAYDLMKPREAIKKYSCGSVSINGKDVMWDKYSVSGTSVAKRALELAVKGDYKNLERLSKFMDKMYQNPSAELVQSGRIYEFMAYSDVEIDDDGDIILYKSVRGNYMDKHSNTISNAPGTIVRMARSFVNDNNSTLCSYGLHVCSLAYLKQCFGSVGQRVVRCKLNPKDIVSITNDYKSSKIRCCEYMVMDDYTAQYNRQYKSIDIEGLYR